MHPLAFIGLTLSACAIAHYSVVFLEPAKASMLKAFGFSALLVLGSNLARWAGFTPDPLLEWSVYIAVATLLVRSLYDLKPFNSVTVGTSYVAGSYVLANAVSGWTTLSI